MNTNHLLPAYNNNTLRANLFIINVFAEFSETVFSAYIINNQDFPCNTSLTYVSIVCIIF